MSEALATDEALIQGFIDAVTRRAKALEKEDATNARRYLRLTNSVYVSIRSRGDGALEKLMAFATHADPDVRLAIAVRALETSAPRAEAILHDLAVAHLGHASITAEYILEAWRAGKRPWDSLGD